MKIIYGTGNQNKIAEIKREFVEDKKMTKIYESCQQALMISLLSLNGYEIEFDKEIPKKKSFTVYDIVAIRKIVNNRIINCGVNEQVTKQMRDVDPKDKDAKRSEYKQKKRNNIIHDYLITLMKNEKCTLDVVRQRVTNKTEMS